jgi:hypothetical protein
MFLPVCRVFDISQQRPWQEVVAALVDCILLVLLKYNVEISILMVLLEYRVEISRVKA